MKKNKITSVLLLIVLCLAFLAPSFSYASEHEEKGLDTFLSVLKAWGTFLAKITGSYDMLDNISLFSSFARMWHDFIGSEGFDPKRFFEAILRWLGIGIMLEQQQGPQESYSI